MGNGSSFEVSRTIHLNMDGKREKIVFSRHMSNRDVHELIAVAANFDKNSTITLKNNEGSIVPVSPLMPSNTQSTPYSVHVKTPRQSEVNTSRGKGQYGKEDVAAILNQVADQFNKVFQVEEMKNAFATRIQNLEKRVEKEGLKAVEIDKCRRDISDIKNQIYDAQKRFIDYNHMRPITADGGVPVERYFSTATDERKIGLKRDIPTYPKYTLSQETTEYLKQPTFDIWHWEPNEMLSLLEHMYHELGLVHEFNMNPITLKRWLLCVQENYRNNPFHNFRHCFCVTQMMYGMINLCKLWEKMSREDLGIMLTAAVCHDLDHPGYNNTYQINARTELAIRYNDISPLENHHCAVAFQILSNPECNIFCNVDEDTFKRIRSGLTMMILSTDMSRHGEIMDAFKSMVECFEFEAKDSKDTGVVMLILATDMARHSEILEAFKAKLGHFDFGSQDHLNSLKMVIIKCCDISNEVRPMSVSEPWVDCLLEEYFNQSDREKEEGLPVAPFMDREKVTKPTAQIGFIKFVLIPMFEQVAKLFPMLEPVMVEPLKKAHSHYEEMKNRTDATKEAMREKSLTKK